MVISTHRQQWNQFERIFQTVDLHSNFIVYSYLNILKEIDHRDVSKNLFWPVLQFSFSCFGMLPKLCLRNHSGLGQFHRLWCNTWILLTIDTCSNMQMFIIIFCGSVTGEAPKTQFLMCIPIPGVHDTISICNIL